MSSTDRFWTRRLRWRLRGAWVWPAFVAITIADGLILHALPPVRTGVEVVPAVIVASFANLVLVGAAAPWLARRLVKRARAASGPAPPYEVTLDRTGTALLAAGALGIVAAGLATRPTIVSETEATERNAELVREHVLAEQDPELLRNLETADTIRLREGYFRTCIAADDRRRAFCFFVDTTAEPPTVKEDPSPVPNADFLGGRAAR